MEKEGPAFQVVTKNRKEGNTWFIKFLNWRTEYPYVQLSPWDFPDASNTLSKKVPNQETVLYQN